MKYAHINCKRTMLFLLLISIMAIFAIFLSSCAKEQMGNQSEIWTLPDTMERVEVDDPVTYLLLRMQKEGKYDYIINVWKDEEGQCGINYIVGQHKEGIFDEAVLHNITAAVNEAAIDGFDRVTIADGNESATINVTYQSGKSVISDFVGQVPEDFSAAFEKVNEFFLELTAELPLAEMKATVEGNVDEKILTEINEVFKEVKHIDELSIFEAVNDEGISISLGLTNTENVIAGVLCAPTMSTTPFRMEIVTLNDTTNIKSTVEDFAANINWNQWVCVAPDKAWIGTKENMVLYVIGGDMTVAETAAGAKSAGWTEMKSLMRR